MRVARLATELHRFHSTGLSFAAPGALARGGGEKRSGVQPEPHPGKKGRILRIYRNKPLFINNLHEPTSAPSKESNILNTVVVQFMAEVKLMWAAALLTLLAVLIAAAVAAAREVESEPRPPFGCC